MFEGLNICQSCDHPSVSPDICVVSALEILAHGSEEDHLDLARQLSIEPSDYNEILMRQIANAVVVVLRNA